MAHQSRDAGYRKRAREAVADNDHDGCADDGQQDLGLDDVRGSRHQRPADRPEYAERSAEECRNRQHQRRVLERGELMRQSFRHWWDATA
jgi:hypothetical protein